MTAPFASSGARTIGEALAAVAASMPEELALVDDGARLTYAELALACRHLGDVLSARGAERGEPVAVVVSPTVEALAAVIGVVANGFVAVPLDARDPAGRLRAVHATLGARVVLSDTRSAGAAEHLGPHTVVELSALRTATGPAAWQPPVVDPDDVATVFFTSGTTGTPKGIAQAHGELVTLAHALATSNALGRGDRVGLIGSLSFGSTYNQVWAGLLNGVPLAVYDLARQGPEGLTRWFSTSGVTVTLMVISVLRGWVAADPAARVTSLRLLTLGGDRFYGRDVARARRIVGDRTTLQNRLGATEVGPIAVRTITDDDARDLDAAVPVGRPLPWVEAQVVDDGGEPVTPGEVGTLVVIGGRGAAGYWRDPELTAERFTVLADGRRAFRTSDLARQRPDGTIELLGRSDHRVKVGGAMVSPSEVERALRTVDGVADTVVLAAPGRDGANRLIAYVVPAEGRSVSAWQVRRDVATGVRPHMVPAVVVPVDAIPVGPRGKVDRGALPPPPPTSRPFREPVGRARVLASLFADVLAVERVGLDDDFFELGGDSLAAIELLALIDDTFGIELSSAALLEAPTVAQLAPRLLRTRPREASTAVALTPGDPAAATPFFCVAGGGSPATTLRTLASELRERPCYGIQARALEERAFPDRSVEACARRYLVDLRAIQPRGPYLLGGFSFGGLVAFEMARRLEAAGEEVASLVLLDAVAPGRRASAAEARAGRRGGRSVAEQVRRAPGALTGRARLACEFATAGLVRRPLRQYRVFFLLSQRMGRRYRPATPPAVAAPALVVRAGDGSGAGLDARLGWDRYLAGPVATVEVAGEHTAVLHHPAVGAVADALRQAFAPVA